MIDLKMYKRKTIAEKLGIAQKTVNSHFNGTQKPSSLYVYAYAYVLNVSVTELFNLFSRMGEND